MNLFPPKVNRGHWARAFCMTNRAATSELMALKWGDIDWWQRRCRITRAITQASKGGAETTKTTAGIRTIDLLHLGQKSTKHKKP